MRNRFLFLIFLLICCAKPLGAQDRFDSGPYKGFSRSPDEHIIVELEQPFRVRGIRGVIRDPSGSPLPKTVFEIRKDSSGKVWGAVADRHGRFWIPGIPPGTYSFKATLRSFQSVAGKITVSARAHRKSAIELILPLGV
ncbi:MAG TPA: carboxypeptidase-like regulatory domain-containing protein [Candidatus Acidoferrales bacterium]|nr:carboxypeptidase-like regulatory domain-containing protein [Candidatus Acidoferrales bacterium]